MWLTFKKKKKATIKGFRQIFESVCQRHRLPLVGYLTAAQSKTGCWDPAPPSRADAYLFSICISKYNLELKNGCWGKKFYNP